MLDHKEASTRFVTVGSSKWSFKSLRLQAKKKKKKSDQTKLEPYKNSFPSDCEARS